MSMLTVYRNYTTPSLENVRRSIGLKLSHPSGTADNFVFTYVCTISNPGVNVSWQVEGGFWWRIGKHSLLGRKTRLRDGFCYRSISSPKTPSFFFPHLSLSLSSPFSSTVCCDGDSYIHRLGFCPPVCRRSS